MSTESARHLADKYSLHILIVVSMALGNFVWDDVRHTLATVQLIQFKQISDGKDIETQGAAIRELQLFRGELEVRLRAKGISDRRQLYGMDIQ